MIHVRDESYLKDFGIHLKTLRIEKGISQERLAVLADISENQIYNVENGKNNCTTCTVKAIARALDIHPKALLDFE